MIDFINVSREIRSLVARRRELLTFLGSVFAALGIFLQNTLKGELPQSLSGLEEHGFATYAFVLLVPSLVLALRLSKMHSGMIINGILYARLNQEQEFAGPARPDALKRAARPNFFGLSFLMFILASFLAAFSAFLLVLAVLDAFWRALGVGAGVFVLWLLLYFRNHRRAATFALKKAWTDTCAPFTRDQWEAHVAGSLEDSNRDMIGVLAVVGLIVFSAFESLSGLGKAHAADLSATYVQAYGSVVYGSLMAITCVLGLLTYLRLRVAVGKLSLLIDPTDQPFRPLRLTDSLLGYMLLAFLFTLSVHFLLFDSLRGHFAVLLAVDAVVFALTVAVEQVTLVVMSRSSRPAKS